MARDAAIIEVRPLRLAAVRRQVTAATLGNAIISAPVWSLLAERGVLDIGRTVVIYWNDDQHSLDAPAGVPVDVGVEVPQADFDHPALSLVHTPAGRAARFHHVGPYEALGDVRSDLRSWCAARGEAIAGVSWEVFDYFDEDPYRCETGVFYLLA